MCYTVIKNRLHEFSHRVLLWSWVDRHQIRWTSIVKYSLKTRRAGRQQAAGTKKKMCNIPTTSGFELATSCFQSRYPTRCASGNSYVLCNPLLYYTFIKKLFCLLVYFVPHLFFFYLVCLFYITTVKAMVVRSYFIHCRDGFATYSVIIKYCTCAAIFTANSILYCRESNILDNSILAENFKFSCRKQMFGSCNLSFSLAKISTKSQHLCCISAQVTWNCSLENWPYYQGFKKLCVSVLEILARKVA